MGEIFINCCLVIVFWFIPGLGCACFMKDFIFDDFNPLWKIPLILIGPLSFAIVILMGIYTSIRKYIYEVRAYYAHKAARKRIEEKRRMREYYEKET